MNKEDIRGISVIAGAVVGAFGNRARMMQGSPRLRKRDASTALWHTNVQRICSLSIPFANPSQDRAEFDS